MATTGGANIVVDGLVFGYDTGYPLVSGSSETYKFNRGEPTTNLVPDNDTKDFEGGGDGSWSYQTVAGSGSISTENPKTGTYSAKLTRAGSGGEVNYWWNAGPGLSLTPGSTYTFSMDVWCDKPGMAKLFSFLAGTNGSSDYHPGDSNWHRLSMQFVPAESTSAAQIRFGILTSNSNYPVTAYFDNTQVELKSHATPFTTGTRTVSGSLIDLTRTNDIDLSNVSFDSNAQMTFDGTDDILNTGLFSGRNPSTSPFTVEAILKSDTTSGNRMWLDATSNGSSQRFYSALDDGGNTPLGIQGSPWSDPIPNTTNFIHQTIVMDGSTARSYRNGVATYTKSYTSYTLTGPLNIGGRSGYKWIGTIPIVKVYNRALSASEVKQNYNALKERFSL